MPESPRFAYRMGRIDEARATMGRLNGVEPHSELVDSEVAEIEEKLSAERSGGDHRWYEVFTGPRMLYRTLLGITLQAGQQLTGANFFFYYGTTIFKSTGISNPYITSIILGSVNVAATIVAVLWIVDNCGRRKSLMVGAAVMSICFLVYSFVGHFALSAEDPMSAPAPGAILIVFTCIFIAAFATTWGPLVWAVVGELYPARYRASGMAIATASNWLMNFLISFFTTFITDAIDYFYGLVFAGCCSALFFIVYFFMIESKDRSLEEIDTMYVLGIDPRKSAKWESWDAESLGKESPNGGAQGNGLMVHDERRFPENPAPSEFVSVTV
jgi:SP family sugar:H+ symporter-like MFS transporter